MARRDVTGVRLITRHGRDFSKRYPLVVAAVATLPVRSCLIDGEVIVSEDSELAVFALLRSWPTNLSAALGAFDLLELDGEDLRRLPIEERKARLARLLRKPSHGIALNEHTLPATRPHLQARLQALCEGIVSKRLGSTYRSINAMGQGQEPGGAYSATRGRGRVAFGQAQIKRHRRTIPSRL